ncbi:hypothetical protein BV25DRAFT_1873051 [Artomyces pyxidatus]|uniref:Uncharacterized protein n=1 Tax=Artomyces pyxidatus TaxID=48021 RepID=A0ACB8SIF1_9AGAM|nr:hypothetical protein BV25DRAFT_1873051 [Artomyces pyxidatus]
MLTVYNNTPGVARGNGGFVLTPRMESLISASGFLTTFGGGQELRDLFSYHSGGFSIEYLDEFAAHCCSGNLAEVMRAVQSGRAPPLDGTETPYRFGYATLVVAGSQRYQGKVHGLGLCAGTLKFLLDNGCPPDVEDICRYTALIHATMRPDTPSQVTCILIDHGADVNHQDIHGMTAISHSIIVGRTEAVDMLMGKEHLPSAGPQISAVISRWLGNRAGEQAPLSDKKCSACGDPEAQKYCSACHTVVYCSAECQHSHWRMHKSFCRRFSASNTVTLKPTYKNVGKAMPNAKLARTMAGFQTEPMTRRERKGSQKLKESAYPKTTKDFACHIERGDAPEAYDRVYDIVREKGLSGLTGYFAAELKSADELVVKVDEILAVQPF